MSPKRTSFLLALTLTLGACTVQVAATPRRPALATASYAPRTSPKVKPNASPTPSPTLAPTAQAPQPRAQLLQAPAGAQPLKGRVTIDAFYAVESGAATLISQDGNSLIGQDGNTLLGPGGASAVNLGAGLVGTDGVSLVAAGAGNLIGQDGNSLIGQDGNSLIGQDGNSMIAAGGGNYALAQASETYDIGALLPAAAMNVQIRAMGTGERIPLGVDTAGNPVYSLLTNAVGEYTAFLPADVSAKNVLVVVSAPRGATDRLRYTQVVQRGTATEDVSEDSAMGSSFFREAFVSRLEQLLTQSGNEEAKDLPAFKQLKLRADTLHVGTLPSRQRRARMRRVADALLADAALDDLEMPDTGQSPRTFIIEVVRDFRVRVTQKMKSNPTMFKENVSIVGANIRIANANMGLAATERKAPYEIRKPADFATYIRDEFLVSPDTLKKTDDIVNVLVAATGISEAEANVLMDRLSAVMNQMLGFAMLQISAEGEVFENAATALGRPTEDN